MRYKWDKKYLYWGITAFLVIIGVEIFKWLFLSGGTATVDTASGTTTSTGGGMIVSFLSKIMGALSPLFYGFAIAYLLNPVENFFENNVYMKLAHRRMVKNDPNHDYGNEAMIKAKKNSRAFGVICAMVTMLLVVTGIIIIILPQLVTTVQKLVGNMQGYFDTFREWCNENLAEYPDLLKTINDNLDNLYKNITSWLTDIFVTRMSEIIETFRSGVTAAIQVLTNLLFGLVIAVYFLYSKDLFAAQLKKMLYSIVSPKYGNAVIRNMRKVHHTFGGFLSGKIIDSLIIMCIFFVVLTVFNFPYAVLCSVFMGILNIIPVFGPFIGAIPCAFLVLLEDPLYCLYFIIIVIIVQQLDGNVIGPLVLGESTGLSSFWIIFSLLLGQSIFGFVGLIIGIPLFAVIYSLVRERVGRKLESKGLPEDSNVYRKVAYVDEETGELVTLYEMNQKEQIRKEKADLEKQTRHGSLIRRFKKNKKHEE